MISNEIVLVERADLKEGITIQNIRTEYKHEEIVSLAHSIIKEQGLLQAIIFREVETPPDANGDTENVLEINAGYKRIRAIDYIEKCYPDEHERLFGDGIPCKEKFGTREDAIVTNIVENLQRSDPSESDICRSILTLINTGYTQKEVSEMISKSEDYVSQRMTIMKFGSEKLKKCLDQREIKFSSAFRLAKLFKDDHEKQDSFIKDELDRNDNISLKSVKALMAKEKRALANINKAHIIRGETPQKSEVIAMRAQAQKRIRALNKKGEAVPEGLTTLVALVEWQFSLGSASYTSEDISDMIDKI